MMPMVCTFVAYLIILSLNRWRSERVNGEEVSVATEYKYLGTVFSINCRDPLEKTIPCGDPGWGLLMEPPGDK